MVKKSQEVSSKNEYSEKGVAKTKTIILDKDIKFKINIKYVSTALPANPSLSCNGLAIEIKEENLR